jgi:hypothetical protein
MQPVALFWPYNDAQRRHLRAQLTRISAGQRRNGQVAGARDTVYGSEGRQLEGLLGHQLTNWPGLLASHGTPKVRSSSV